MTGSLIFSWGKVNFTRCLANVVSYFRADVTEDRGWVVLELEGEMEEIERGVQWVVGLGVRVDPVAGDIVEG